MDWKEGLLEIGSFEMTTKGVGSGTLSKSWRERVTDFRSCNTEAAGVE